MMSERADGGRAGPDLEAALEVPIPSRLPVGGPTAVLCRGTCFHRRHAVERVTILVDGAPHRPTASRMPRPDLFRSLHPRARFRGEAGPGVDRGPRSALLPQRILGDGPDPGAHRPGEVELRVDAALANGARASATLGRIEVVEPARPLGTRPRRPRRTAA